MQTERENCPTSTRPNWLRVARAHAAAYVAGFKDAQQQLSALPQVPGTRSTPVQSAPAEVQAPALECVKQEATPAKVVLLVSEDSCAGLLQFLNSLRNCPHVYNGALTQGDEQDLRAQKDSLTNPLHGPTAASAHRSSSSTR